MWVIEKITKVMVDGISKILFGFMDRLMDEKYYERKGRRRP